MSEKLALDLKLHGIQYYNGQCFTEIYSTQKAACLSVEICIDVLEMHNFICISCTTVCHSIFQSKRSVVDGPRLSG